LSQFNVVDPFLVLVRYAKKDVEPNRKIVSKALLCQKKGGQIRDAWEQYKNLFRLTKSIKSTHFLIFSFFITLTEYPTVIWLHGKMLSRDSKSKLLSEGTKKPSRASQLLIILDALFKPQKKSLVSGKLKLLNRQNSFLYGSYVPRCSLFCCTMHFFLLYPTLKI
jgi:hypothetical protein